MDKEIMMQFYDAFWLIQSHPAFLGIPTGISSIDIHTDKCCVNGMSQTEIVTVSRDQDRFDEFLGKGHKEDFDKDNPEFDEIWVPYKDFYGCPWEADHVEIWLEGGAHFYDATDDKFPWQSFHDIELDTGGRTYEESIISFADLVKEKYGDYSCEETDSCTVIPEWIIEHNKQNPLFPEDRSNWFKDGQFNTNPKNIRISDQERNALWWHVNGIDERDSWLSDKLLDITKYLTKENFENSIEGD